MRTWITREPIAPAEVLALVAHGSHGATVLFLGHVRDVNEGRPVTGVHYEAYLEMAERTLHDIATEVSTRLDSEQLAVVHRIGELGVGELSLAIAVSAPHRGEAFAACRAALEEIKRRLPIWKEEHYADAGRRWLPGDMAAGGGTR
jgi:molybdopterin synthase catalytic subunit